MEQSKYTNFDNLLEEVNNRFKSLKGVILTKDEFRNYLITAHSLGAANALKDTLEVINSLAELAISIGNIKYKQTANEKGEEND